MSEIYTVLGVARYDFERDGQHLSGVTLYCSYKSERVTGLCTEKVSISDRILDGLLISVGDEVRFMYNKYGKVSGVEIQ